MSRPRLPTPSRDLGAAVLCGIGLEGCNSFRRDRFEVVGSDLHAASGGLGDDSTLVGDQRSRAWRIRSAVAFGRVMTAR
jgi:hypothetical protein